MGRRVAHRLRMQLGPDFEPIQQRFDKRSIRANHLRNTDRPFTRVDIDTIDSGLQQYVLVRILQFR